MGTSVLFLGTILAVVIYLTVTDKDRTETLRPLLGDHVPAGGDERNAS